MLRVTLTYKGTELKTYDTDKKEITIGRREDCDIPLDNIGISKKHARIYRKESSYWIEDLDSTNGTLLNGEKVRSAQLAEGDTVRVIKFELKISYPKAQPATPTPGPGNPPIFKL